MKKLFCAIMAVLAVASVSEAGFAGYLRQSSGVTVSVGPFLDSTDGNTEEGGLTISQADVKLAKNGVTFTQKNDANACVLDSGTSAYYNCGLSTTDTNTLGLLRLIVHESGALLVDQAYQVVTSNVWDTMFSTDKLEVDITQVGGDAIQDNNDGRLEVNVEEWKDAAAPAMTGDAYAVVADGTYGNSALEALVDDLESRLTATRAGYLDNLNSGVTSSTVSDKTGYSLSASQTFNVTGNITGNLSGSVNNVASGVTVSDKTGFSLADDQSGVTIGYVASGVTLTTATETQIDTIETKVKRLVP